MLGTTAFSALLRPKERKSSLLKPFGKTADGREITLYTLANKKGHGSDHHELWRRDRFIKGARP